MDIKVEEEGKYKPCQGCLTTDRKVSSVGKPCRSIFFQLIGDSKHNVPYTKDLILCWECTAILNKVQLFRRRIQRAQHALTQYLHTFCLEGQPHTLSSLKVTSPKQYDLEIDYEKQNPVVELAEEIKNSHEPLIDIKDEDNAKLKEESVTEDTDFAKITEDGTTEETDFANFTEGVTTEDTVFAKIAEDVITEDTDFAKITENVLTDDTVFAKITEDVITEDTVFAKITEDVTTEDTDFANLTEVVTTEDTVFGKIAEDVITADTDFAKLTEDVTSEDTDFAKIKDVMTDDEVTDLFNVSTEYNCDDLPNFFKPRTKIKGVKAYATFKPNTELCLTEIDRYYEIVHLSEQDVEDTIEKRERRNRKGLCKLAHECKQCKLGYSRRVDLLRHTQFRHNDNDPSPPHVCLACDAALDTYKLLQSHWREQHSKMLRCTLCSENCRSLFELKKHLKRFHSKVYSCNVCERNFCFMYEFTHHYKKLHEFYTCDHCGKTVRKRKTLVIHIRHNHTQGYCKICNRTFATYYGFVKHSKMFHPRLTRQELAYCVECNKQFSSVQHYNQHLRHSARHTPQPKVRVPCPDCGKIFSRKCNMNNHYALVHVKSTKHYCEPCNKFFVTPFALRNHIQYVHQKIAVPKDKICDLCGRGFGSNIILANHRRTHTGERPYQCQFCPATFAQQTAMKSHEKTQHKNYNIK